MIQEFWIISVHVYGSLLFTYNFSLKIRCCRLWIMDCTIGRGASGLLLHLRIIDLRIGGEAPSVLSFLKSDLSFQMPPVLPTAVCKYCRHEDTSVCTGSFFSHW